MSVFILMASAALVLAQQTSGAPTGLQRFSYTQYHMGIDARLVYYAPDLATAEAAGTAAFARIAVLDSIMSDYRVDSELNRLCEKAGGPAVKVSPDLFRVLQRAQEVAKRSGGAFDVTAGPLIRLWRAARRAKKLPTIEEIRATQKLIGYRKMILNARNQTVRLTTAGMKLDLGGIAKGFAADEAQKVLKKFGVTRALVELGGDIVVSDAPPDSDGWLIRVPNAGDEQGPAELKFMNRAISSSGDTVQFTEIGGVRYSHVVDPRTGWALTEGVQVTLTAADGLTSDPLSTALTIVTPAQRAKLLRAYPGTVGFTRIVRG